MDSICRTCMSKEQEMVSIFDQSKSPSINAMIIAISPLKIVPDDTLPQQICITCLETVEVCYYFKERMIRCDNTLHKLAETSKLFAVKKENEEREEDGEVYNEQDEQIPHVDSDEISGENVGELPSKSHTPLVLVGPELLKTEPQDDDLPEDSSFDDIMVVDELITEDNCEETSEQKSKSFEFSSKDGVPLTRRHVDSESRNISQDTLQNSNENSTSNNIEKYAYKNSRKSNKCGATEKAVKGPFKCQYCNATFKHSGYLNRHIRMHTGEATPKLFKCEFCEKTFSQNCNLEVHKRTHTNERPFKCEHCSMTFIKNSNLYRHYVTHTGERPFQCQHCNARFTQKSNLIEHNRSHTGERPFKCQLCNAAFMQKRSLIEHIRTHTGERPFKCQHCDAKFTQKSSLIQHNRMHTGERPFKCQQCNATFLNRGDLNRHTRTHTGEKPFKCQHCSGKFTQSSHLIRHIQTMHKGESISLSKS